ncbi:MAG: glycosyltransferase family 39 protein [Chloroflexota bacterium]
MANSEQGLSPVGSILSPPETDEARRGGLSDTPVVSPEPAAPAEVAPETAAKKKRPRRNWGAMLKDFVLRVWRSRGFFGGLIAMGIGFLGQQALLAENDYATSTRNYLIAFAIVILTLMHPSMPRFGRKKVEARAAEVINPSALAPTEVAQASPGDTPLGAVAPLPQDTYYAAPLPTRSVSRSHGAAATSPLSVPLTPDGAPHASGNGSATPDVQPILPTRPVRSRTALNGSTSHEAVDGATVTGGSAAIPAAAPPTAQVIADKNKRGVGGLFGRRSTGSVAAEPARVPLTGSPWRRYQTIRARMGWRLTLPGLLLTFALAAGSYLVLQRDITNPLGGWLWAGALVMLLLAVLGAPGWPSGESLLEKPSDEFFYAGQPRIPAWLETAFVVIIIAIAFAMRFYNLENHPGIHGDEGEQGTNVQAIIDSQPIPIFGMGWWSVPNLSFYIWQFPMRLFGDTTMVGDRMFGVISGVLAVWFLYKTVRLLFGPRAGLIAGAMLAISPLAVQYARFSNVSAETFALWTIGFYFFFMALRYRRWSDWALAGFFWSLNLYFYPSGKLILPLIGLIGLYCLIRWRMQFFKRYFLGFAMLGLAFALTFLPYFVYSMKDHWQAFAGRANETSIFSPVNQARTFGRYGLTYDPNWANKSMVDNIRSEPAAWAGLLYQQTRETLDVLYRRGDTSFYYIISEHNGSALQPFWAVLGLLGLAYAAYKFWDSRFAIPLLWLFVGFAGAILTTDTPTVQRITGGWPAMMIFPAVLLDRVMASSWPLNRNLARKWLTLPLVVLMVYLGVDSAREYFVHFYEKCPFCRDTAQARYAVDLGQEYKGYQMGVGGWEVYFGYGSTRYLAKGVEGVDMLYAADRLPLLDNNGKGAAFIIYPNNYEYLPLLRAMYPQGIQEPILSHDGVVQFTSFKVPLAELEASRRLHASYTLPAGNTLTRDEANLGTSSSNANGDWTPPDGIAYPAQAEWHGGLVAPTYGAYTLALDESGGPSGAKLELDGKVVLEAKPGTPHPKADMVLAKGMHEVRLTGTLRDANTKFAVTWAGLGNTPGNIEPLYFFNGPTGGLSGQIGNVALAPADAMKQQNPFEKTAPTSLRVDPFIGFREASLLFGNSTFLARWQGKLDAAVEGDYVFSLNASQPGVVLIDGRTVVGDGPDGPGAAVAHLTQGQHNIDVRFVASGYPVRIELSWTPPGQGSQIIPPNVLTPLERSWPQEQVPNAPPGQFPSAIPQKSETLAPDRAFGASDLANPRGLAIDTKGNIYVGDNDNHRIVVYGPDGKVINTWGKAATEYKQGEAVPPTAGGEFYEINDIAISAEGTVYVMDRSTRIQAFSSTGEFKGSYEPTQLNLYGPTGIYVAGTGSEEHIYVAVTGQNRILKLPPIASWPKNGAPPPAMLETITVGVGDIFEQPVDMVMDPTGTGIMYALDLKDRIMQLTPKVGQAGGPPVWVISRQWNVPVGRDNNGSRIAVSPDGRYVYMTDPDRKRVDVIDIERGKLSFFGEDGRNAGQFTSPSGAAVGQDGSVYVLDSTNGVQVFTLPKESGK